MAKAFQDMLEWFGLTKRISGINGDNTSANDKQTTKLSSLNSSFKEEYQALCFNHTLHLSTKTLLKPFNTTLSTKAADEVNIRNEDNDNPPILVDPDCYELSVIYSAPRVLVHSARTSASPCQSMWSPCGVRAVRAESVRSLCRVRAVRTESARKPISSDLELKSGPSRQNVHEQDSNPQQSAHVII